MNYVTNDYSLLKTRIREFDDEAEAKQWTEDNDGFILSKDITQWIGKEYSIGDDLKTESPDEVFGFFAVDDYAIDFVDIEAFFTEEDRAAWCSEKPESRIRISRNLARAMLEHYDYIDDMPFSRDGITYINYANLSD